MLALPRRYDRLRRRRAGVHAPWPDDHPDRAEETAPAVGGGGESVIPPVWPWLHDQTPEGTKDFHSIRRDMVAVGLADADGRVITDFADGPLHVRAAMAGPVVHLHPLSRAENGSERFLESSAPVTHLAPGDQLTGRLRLIAIVPGKDIP